MYKQGQEITVNGERRQVIAVIGSMVWHAASGKDVAHRSHLLDTYPIPPAGRECGGWRLPAKGDTYYDPTGEWLTSTITFDLHAVLPYDQLGVGHARPCLKPVTKNIVKGIEVNDSGEAIVRHADTSHEPTRLKLLESASDEFLASYVGYSPADIALIRKGLPAEVQAYLDAKPADAAAFRLPKKGDWIYTFPQMECVEIHVDWKNEIDVHPLRSRRWIRKAQPAELWVMVGPAFTDGSRLTSLAFPSRSAAELAHPGWTPYRLIPAGDAP